MVRMGTALGITRRWDHSERKKKESRNSGASCLISPLSILKYGSIITFFFLQLIISPRENLQYVFNSFFFSLYQFSQLLTGLPSLVNHTQDFLGGVAAVAAAEAESAVPAGWRGSGLEGEIVF